MNYYLAVDIGASSGRHVLGYLENGKIMLEEVYRFDNYQVEKNGYQCWDLDYLMGEIIKGLAQCKEIGKIPKTMGIDTWAVDYCLLDENKKMIGNSVSYRDRRTQKMKELSEKTVSATELYSKTGIQFQPFNTLFQLLSQKQCELEILEKAEYFLMIPEYLNFLLTGKMMNEYTNASTTNLVNAKEKTWDYGLIEKFGFPRKLFKQLHLPTEEIGNFTEEIKEKVGFDCTVILPATHDTASAFVAVPSVNENSIFISSGTWSLIGVENEEAITSEKSRELNFSNEGGAEYRFRYLKNIMGLWIIQSARRELNGVSYVKKQGSDEAESVKKYSFDDLVDLAKEAVHFNSVIDVDDESFLSPDSMIEAIKEYCLKTKQEVPQTVGEIFKCIYISLANKYAKSVKELEMITQKEYEQINIVGGGSKDEYLNQLTAQITGKKVLAGPFESTSLGNIAVQMIAKNEVSDIVSVRKVIKNSFEVKLY